MGGHRDSPVSAEPPTFTVEEQIVEGGGEEGLIVFEHDPVAETLSFRWEAFESGTTATGTLTRTN